MMSRYSRPFGVKERWARNPRPYWFSSRSPFWAAHSRAARGTSSPRAAGFSVRSDRRWACSIPRIMQSTERPYRPIAGYASVQLLVARASDCRFELRLIATLPPGYLKSAARQLTISGPAKFLFEDRSIAYLETGQLRISATAGTTSEASDQAGPSRQQLLQKPHRLPRAGKNLGNARPYWLSVELI